ncbi:hypothetical protein DRF65_04055 [Chryseobacterium pennae]|uniref:Uncharacterized protein n=1 Tax=Chryseobacterium pennae TaxID=2258962 RepID=A0A3D9CDR4_9FLAO|nr:hypothetical protein DRF65_04055 [Chryseobacterium pennae]
MINNLYHSPFKHKTTEVFLNSILPYSLTALLLLSLKQNFRGFSNPIEAGFSIEPVKEYPIKIPMKCHQDFLGSYPSNINFPLILH